MGTAYDEKDAAQDTDSSDDDVKGAWHNARNDSVDDERSEGRDEKKESATRDANYYTDEKWNPITQEWE